jgi:hypothetical protein
LVNAHPIVRPLGLIVGVPGVAGPGESVAHISDVFLNAGRVGKEHLKLKKGSQVGGDAFIASFAKFSAEHPMLRTVKNGPPVVTTLMYQYIAVAQLT